MSFLEYLKINSALTWRQTEFTNNVLLLEQGSIAFSNNLTSGTGIGQVNKSYFDAYTLNTGENLQLDLFNLNRSIFGKNLQINFSGDNLKLLIIENTSTGINQDIFLCGTGTAGLTNPLSWDYLGVIIKPKSYYITIDRNTGWEISTGERVLYIQDINDTAPSYEIGIFGVHFG